MTLFMRHITYLWTLPNTLVGSLLALPALVFGGRVQLVSGVVEVHGPLLRLLLSKTVPLAGGAMAVTIGHVVLGASKAALDVTRDHERVHVRQYERWGPFFIPAYLLASLMVWVQGGRPYRDNPFEKQAYRVHHSGGDSNAV